MTINQDSKKIRESISMEAFKKINYDYFNKDDQENIKRAMMDMMIKFRYIPIELGEGIPEDLFNKLDAKWKWALSIERKIRETTLAKQ